MERPMIAFAAIYLKSAAGYFAFIEELPVVFDEERRASEELLKGKDVVREGFLLPILRES